MHGNVCEWCAIGVVLHIVEKQVGSLEIIQLVMRQILLDSQVEQIELFEVVLGVKTKALQEVLIGVHLNQIIGEVG